MFKVKLVSKKFFSAMFCGVIMFSMVACGGGNSVGKSFAKDLCECSTSISDKSGFEMLGCMLILAEKYKEHFDDQNFKNSKDDKDFIVTLKKCDPELAKEILEQRKK